MRMRMRILPVIALLAVVINVPNARIVAQQPPVKAAEWVMERQLRERWLHGRQAARFTPFTSHRRALHVDSIRDHASRRQLFITTDRTAFGRDSTVITTDSRGRVLTYLATQAPYRTEGPRYPGDSASMTRFRRFRNVASYTNPSLLDLVGTRSWDLVATFPNRPAPGVQWTDTIGREAVDDGHRQTLRGRRTSRIIRDTLVDGRRMWIVRDSAQLTYTEQFPEEERTIDSAVEVSRSVSGVERGLHVFDPALGLYRWRHDTATLRGEAVLHYPDGRRFRTPATYERTRQWVLRDSTQYASRVAELNAEMRRTSGGMVRVPTQQQRRVLEGGTAVRDSLVREWQRSADANASEEIFRTLTAWSGRDTLFARSLDSLRIGAGDSVFLYRQLASRAYTTRSPPDSADIARMIPFMENPGIAWGFNLSRDWLYENLVQALTTWPPVIARDRDRVACTPAACRLLAAQWRSAREPRTRDVALVALYVLDPALWADTVLKHDSSSRPLLNAATQLVRGVGANWPAASKRPMVAPNSDWRDWLEWMNGVDTAYARIHDANAIRYGWPRDTVKRPRFEENHRVAIRMQAKQTGRDIVADLHRGYENAQSDKERLVFGTMLRGLGELRLTAEEIAVAFRSGVPERINLARGALMELLAREARPIDSAIASPLVDRLIAATVDNWPLWPSGAADLGPGSAGRPELHARRGRVVLSSENLPADLVEKWGRKLEIITPADRRQLDPREATVVYTVSRVTGIGPFAMIEMQAAEQLARPADHAPAHYASAAMYYLMNRDGEWVIVAVEGWVT